MYYTCRRRRRRRRRSTTTQREEGRKHTTAQEEEGETCTTPKEEREKASLAHKRLNAAPFAQLPVGGAFLSYVWAVLFFLPSFFGVALLWLVLSHLCCGVVLLFHFWVVLASPPSSSRKGKARYGKSWFAFLLVGGPASRPFSCVAVLLSHLPPFAWCCFLPPDDVCSVLLRISLSNFGKTTTKNAIQIDLKRPNSGFDLVFKGGGFFGCLFLDGVAIPPQSVLWVFFFSLSLFVGGAAFSSSSSSFFYKGIYLYFFVFLNM